EGRRDPDRRQGRLAARFAPRRLDAPRHVCPDGPGGGRGRDRRLADVEAADRPAGRARPRPARSRLDHTTAPAERRNGAVAPAPKTLGQLLWWRARSSPPNKGGGSNPPPSLRA